ncbi:MAG: alkyl sulfatase dimerization domain-containing protein [Pseudomonadota bacterium]
MPHQDLIAHGAQTAKDIVELGPGIWMAVGYAASNVHMIEGHETVTIIDATESTKAAQNILSAFRELCEKPVGRIIYTHSHRDHISGASVFSDGSVPIYACHLFKSDLIAADETVIAPNKALGRRTQTQFGIGLLPQERISLGCGPGDRPMEGLGAGSLEPTHLIEQDCDLDLDGVKAELKLIPGETEDHMVVYLPKQNILFCGDNWYHAFPNLYAIRGTPYRNFAAWVDGLSALSEIGAEVLSPGHTRPVFGAENVHEVLTTTRDAIQHVMMETASGMDDGQSLDDIVSEISLPEPLADKPRLKEFYGKIGWSARAFASGTLGWYDGNPTNLGTLSTRAGANHMAKLSGGIDALKKAAIVEGDLQWRLELLDHLLALGEDVADLKAETLEALAEDELNATARNTYLWEAKRLRS